MRSQITTGRDYLPELLVGKTLWGLVDEKPEVPGWMLRPFSNERRDDGTFCGIETVGRGWAALVGGFQTATPSAAS